MNRFFETLRLAQLQAARAQVRLRELNALPTPSREAYVRAESRIQREVAQRATRNASSTPRRRIEQLDRMAELKSAALGRVKRLRERLVEEARDRELRRLVGKVASFDLINRRLKHLALTTNPRSLEPYRETTLIVETGKRSKAEDVANDVFRVLGSVLKTGSDRSWVQVEPLYRKHRVDEIFSVRIAIQRREVFPRRFRLAAHLRKGCGFRSVQYERADHLRLLCDWRHTDPTPSDTEWSLRVMNVFDAWDITPPDGGARKGLGVVIGHPDTGWNVHPEYDVEHIDVERAHNTFFDSTGEDAAKHPTFLQAFPINNLTHGTGTGSVIVSGVADDRRTQVNPVPGGAGQATEGEVEITGVAPRATIVPVRCVDAVELAPDNRNLGRAIEYLMDLNDPPVSVISISVGGAPHYSLEGIIRRAVTEKNIIVVAAAGQYAFSTWDNSVIEPADYQHVVAVAGCTDIPHPWSLSLQGPRVAVSAPARGVYCADYANSATVTPVVLWGEGTSFSAAEVAGVAALWIAFWGRDALACQVRRAGSVGIRVSSIADADGQSFPRSQQH